MRTLLIAALLALPRPTSVHNTRMVDDAPRQVVRTSSVEVANAGNLPVFYAPLTDSIAEVHGIPATFANVGPIFQWENGLLVEHADDAPRFGGQIAPGLTGSGNTFACYQTVPSYTNAILYSRDFSNAAWGKTGTSVVSAASVSLFADGRQMYKVTDDDTGSFEVIAQDIDITALNTGDPITLIYDTMLESGTGQATMVARAQTGCTAQNIIFNVFDTSTSIKRAQSTATLHDGNCTSLRVYVYPVSANSNNAATGHVVASVQVLVNSRLAPPTYIETQAAAVTAGGDDLQYPSATLPASPARVQMDIIPNSDWSGNSHILFSTRTGGGTGGYDAYIDPLGFLYVRPNGTSFFTSSGSTYAPGARYGIKMRFADGGFTVHRDGELLMDKVAALPTSHPQVLDIGSYQSAANGSLGGWICNVRWGKR